MPMALYTPTRTNRQNKRGINVTGYQPYRSCCWLVLLAMNAFAFPHGAAAAPSSETDSSTAKEQAAMASLTGKMIIVGANGAARGFVLPQRTARVG